MSKEEKVMSKLELLKELYIMVQKKNYAGEYEIGQRTGTSKDKNIRCKDISAFFMDLFDINENDSSEVEDLLFMLEEAIHNNICVEEQ